MRFSRGILIDDESKHSRGEKEPTTRLGLGRGRKERSGEKMGSVALCRLTTAKANFKFAAVRGSRLAALVQLKLPTRMAQVAWELFERNVVLAVALGVLFALAVLWLLFSSSASNKARAAQSTVLLVGPLASGKTALFSKVPSPSHRPAWATALMVLFLPPSSSTATFPTRTPPSRRTRATSVQNGTPPCRMGRRQLQKTPMMAHGRVTPPPSHNDASANPPLFSVSFAPPASSRPCPFSPTSPR